MWVIIENDGKTNPEFTLDTLHKIRVTTSVNPQCNLNCISAHASGSISKSTLFLICFGNSSIRFSVMNRWIYISCDFYLEINCLMFIRIHLVWELLESPTTKHTPLSSIPLLSMSSSIHLQLEKLWIEFSNQTMVRFTRSSTEPCGWLLIKKIMFGFLKKKKKKCKRS